MTVSALRFPLRAPVSITVVGPADVVAAYVGGFFKRTETSDGLQIAEAIYEPVGVLNRRGAVIHWFTVEQLVKLWQIVAANGHLMLVMPHVGSLPADWRFPA